jgi:probable rRNA maturation factor
MPISVAIRGSSRGLTAPLSTIVRATLSLERRTPGEIGILLADDATLRSLNQAWRGIDRATDVLSFSYDEAAGGAESPRERMASRQPTPRRVNGDLVVSLDRMRDQARRYRVTPARELARLVVHGTLHLAGHDHARAAERGRMRRREAAALRACATAIRSLDLALRPSVRQASRATLKSPRRGMGSGRRASD